MTEERWQQRSTESGERQRLRRAHGSVPPAERTRQRIVAFQKTANFLMQKRTTTVRARGLVSMRRTFLFMFLHGLLAVPLKD